MFLSIYFFQFICSFQFIYIKDFFIYLSYNLERQIIFIQSSEADSKSSDGILAQFLQWIKNMSRVFIEKLYFCLGRKSCPKANGCCFSVFSTWQTYYDKFEWDILQKQPYRGVLRKRRSENMQQIYRRTPTLKCDFNKVASFKRPQDIFKTFPRRLQDVFKVYHHNKLFLLTRLQLLLLTSKMEVFCENS